MQRRRGARRTWRCCRLRMRRGRAARAGTPRRRARRAASRPRTTCWKTPGALIAGVVRPRACSAAHDLLLDDNTASSVTMSSIVMLPCWLMLGVLLGGEGEGRWPEPSFSDWRCPVCCMGAETFHDSTSVRGARPNAFPWAAQAGAPEHGGGPGPGGARGCRRGRAAARARAPHPPGAPSLNRRTRLNRREHMLQICTLGVTKT